MYAFRKYQMIWQKPRHRNSGRSQASKRKRGFSLIEVLVAMAIMSVAILGLAQLFLLSVMQNARSDWMTNGTFLTQQRVDEYRSLTMDELSNEASKSPMSELIDVNLDGIDDFRRITEVTSLGSLWRIRVLVFSGPQSGISVSALKDDPELHGVRAVTTTVISR